MNYPQSQEVFEKVRHCKKILLSCHQSPDPDSVGSSLALHFVLKEMGIESDIVCIDDTPEDYGFMPGSELIKKVDFLNFDYSPYDLFMVPDTSSWKGVVIDESIPHPSIELIILDHHVSNVGWGGINLVDPKATSACEVVYKLLEDWEVGLNHDIATLLLTGIISDTGSFQFHIEPETLDIASRLMKIGVDKDEITFNLYKNLDFFNIELMGKILLETKLDTDAKILWVAIPWEKLKDYPEDFSTQGLDLILPKVKGIKFAIRMFEKKQGNLSVSFRAREKFDTSKIAVELGGGGHKDASGAHIVGIEFDQAVEKVLNIARKYAGEH